MVCKGHGERPRGCARITILPLPVSRGDGGLGHSPGEDAAFGLLSCKGGGLGPALLSSYHTNIHSTYQETIWEFST